jgi:hypothetical protein
MCAGRVSRCGDRFRDISKVEKDWMKDIREVPPAYLVAIAVLAVAVIGFFGFRTLSGPSYPVGPDMHQAYKTIDDMARSSGGDFSKLTPDEQKQINDFARGNGKNYLAKRYKVITGEK